MIKGNKFLYRFEDKQISNVYSKVVSLSENISASAELPLKDKKLLILYEFAKVDPKFLRDDQFVEVLLFLLMNNFTIYFTQGCDSRLICYWHR